MVEELVCENLLTVNGWNVDTLGKLIAGNDLKSIKYIVSLNDVKQRCLKDNKVRWRVLFWMLKCGDKELVNYLMKELEFSTESLIELISNYWYPVSKCTGN